MFRRFEMSPIRWIFWLGTTILYWMLISAAWGMTRLRVFMGYEIFQDITARKKLGAILADMPSIVQRAAEAIVEAGPFPKPLFAVPVLMAIVMFVAPYVVRRDNRRPFTGVFMLPFMTMVSYLLAMLVNMVVAASVEIGLHFWLGIKPGPDFFMFLLHPFYLLYPPSMSNVYGLIAQLVYILFIASILSTKNSSAYAADDGEPDSSDDTEDRGDSGDDSEVADVFVMETDRLCRMITGKFRDPALTLEVRRGLTDYISRPGQVERAASGGHEPYRIVLLEAAKTLRTVIESQPGRFDKAPDAFIDIVDEMARLEYCTEADAETLKKWVAVKRSQSAREARHP